MLPSLLRTALCSLLLASSGCETCVEQLHHRARAAGAPGAFDWPDVNGQAHLHLTRDDLAWDMATDAFHVAQRSGTCPDPLPNPPSILATAAGGWQVTGLHAVLQERPGIRIAPDVPYRRVRWLLEKLRAAGMAEVDLRRIRCLTPTSCFPQALRVALHDFVPDGQQAERDPVRERLDEEDVLGARERGERVVLSSPATQSELDLRVEATDEGWRVAGFGGALLPGCTQTSPDAPTTVPEANGFGAVVTCLRRVKREFPNEVWIVLSPGPDRIWMEVAAQIQSLRFDRGAELFPEVRLP